MRDDPVTGKRTDQPWGRGLLSLLALIMGIAVVRDAVERHWRAVAIEVAIVVVVVLVVLLARSVIRRVGGR